MKKILPIIVFVLILCFCKENKEVRKNEFNYFWNKDKEFVELNIDSFSNFKDLFEAFEKSICNSNITLIRFENDSTIYRIEPINFCPNDNTIVDYRLNEVVYIDFDSIFVNYNLRYPIDNLKSIIENHLINKKSDENYPEVKNQGFFEICIDNEAPIKKVNKLFQRIMNDFNKININNCDSLRLLIFLTNNKPPFELMKQIETEKYYEKQLIHDEN